MEDVSTFAAILLDPIIAPVSKDTFCTKMTMIAKKEDASMK